MNGVEQVPENPAQLSPETRLYVLELKAADQAKDIEEINEEVKVIRTRLTQILVSIVGVSLALLLNALVLFLTLGLN